MRALRFIGLLAAVAAIGGCPGAGFDQRNPFLTVTENFGVSIFGDEGEEGAAAGQEVEAEFRQRLTLTLANRESDAELNTAWAAWINTSSIRSADQQDTLLANGYVQLTRRVEIGTVFTLPPGTFVFNGPGIAGATLVRIEPAESDEAGNITPREESFELITPDVLLVFSQPPVSCDTPAFFFTLDGLPLDVLSDPAEGFGAAFGGATTRGPVKTLAQIDVYQCSPFRPGLFFKAGGGAREENEFFEGQDIRFDFVRFSIGEERNSAFVSIGDVVATFEDTQSGGTQEPQEQPTEEPQEEPQQPQEGEEGPP